MSSGRTTSYEITSERRADLDVATVPIFTAQRRLAAARDVQGEAAGRAGALKRAVEEARHALRERGWTEQR